MNKLQLTMDALQTALADAPETPTAWVPLRRIAVEEALRMLGGVGTAVDALRRLESEIEDDRPAWLVDTSAIATLAAQATTVIVPNGNGHVAVMPVEPGDNHVVIHPQAQAMWQRITANAPVMDGRKPKAHQPAPDKTTNTWRRKPKAERLAIVQQTIAALAVNGWLTQTQFDQGKPVDMPTGTAHVAAFKMSWNDLVQSALPAPAEGEGAPADGGSTFRA